MKYSCTIAIKAISLLLFTVVFSGAVNAQKNTDSPYSRYGIGLHNPNRFNGNFALGGSGIAWRPFQFKPLIYDSLARSNAQLNDRGSNFINPSNPASFSNVSLTTFEMGAISRNVAYSSNGQEKNGSNTQLSHMAIAFPIGENLGAAFGIRPHSFVGYDYSFSEIVNQQEISNSYEGSGGINEIFVGFGYEFGNSISLGVTGKYHFGKIIDQRRVVYNTGTNFFNSLDERETRIGALTYQLGVQYFKDINKDYRFIVGVVASPISGFKAEQARIMRNYTGFARVENFRDTAVFFSDRNVTIQNAPEYGVGFSYEKKLEWMITADYKTQSFDGVLIENGISLNNSQQFSVGFDKYINLNSLGSYMSKMGYRGGLRYNSALLTVNGEDISEFGISFGISMPLRKTFSTINIAAEVGQRGEDKNGLTQENFFSLQFGVTINDKWFIQRKYD